MNVWQFTFRLILTVLGAGVLIIITSTFSDFSFNGKSICSILISRKKIVLSVLGLFSLAIPIMFSPSAGEFLSPQIVAVYIRELLISVVIVVSFRLTWNELEHPGTLYASVEHAIASLRNLHKSNPGTGTRSKTLLNEALLAWDQGEISEARVKEIQLLESLKKWIWQEYEISWYELKEEIDPDDWTQHIGAHFLVEREMWRIQQRESKGQLDWNQEYEKQLRELASLFRVPSFDKAILAWDQGEITDDKMREIQALESLEKWVWQEDKTGWRELQEIIDPNERLQYLGVYSLVERELWHIRRERQRTKREPKRNGKYEQRLRSILSLQEA